MSQEAAYPVRLTGLHRWSARYPVQKEEAGPRPNVQQDFHT